MKQQSYRNSRDTEVCKCRTVKDRSVSPEAIPTLHIQNCTNNPVGHPTLAERGWFDESLEIVGEGKPLGKKIAGPIRQSSNIQARPDSSPRCMSARYTYITRKATESEAQRC